MSGCCMVLTGNLPFTQWASAFAYDQTLTAAMPDRLLDHAHIVQWPSSALRLSMATNSDRSIRGSSRSRAVVVLPTFPEKLMTAIFMLLYHALRREELCKLTAKDFRHERRGVAHLKVSGKVSKTRYVPLHVEARSTSKQTGAGWKPAPPSSASA